MGKGGFFNIINATPYVMQAIAVHSKHMVSWDDKFISKSENSEDGSYLRILPNNNYRFYFEFNSAFPLGLFKKWNGTVEFQLDGYQPKHQIKIEAKEADGSSGSNADFQLFCKIDLPASHFVVIPMQNPGNLKSVIDFCHDGTASILISLLPSPKNPLAAISFSKLKSTKKFGLFTRKYEVADWMSSWMGKYKHILGELTLHQMIFPGTHNAGSYKMKHTISHPWAQCQDISILNQLLSGSRSLDLRIGYNQDASQPNKKFVIVHDTWKSEQTVHDVLTQVRRFLTLNDDEIIILDLHRFISIKCSSKNNEPIQPINVAFPFQELQDTILKSLGNLVVEKKLFGQPLKKIWETTGRIVVSYNRRNIYNEEGNAVFKKTEFVCKGVAHHWYDESSRTQLQKALKIDFDKIPIAINSEIKGSMNHFLSGFISNTLQPEGQQTPDRVRNSSLPIGHEFEESKEVNSSPILHHKNRLWAVCAVVRPKALKPLKPLKPHLHNWFYAGNDWIMKSNIIYVDFIQKIRIVEAALISNIYKAYLRKAESRNIEELLDQIEISNPEEQNLTKLNSNEINKIFA